MTNLIIFFYFAWIVSTTWHHSVSKLPRAECSLAAGYYNKSVYLLGGDANRRQFVEYNITDDTFIDHGTEWFPIDIRSYSDYYTQVNNLLYLKSDEKTEISVFDMKSMTFIPSYTDIIDTEYNIKYACITATDQSIFVVGGKYYSSTYFYFTSNAVHIYDIFTNQWTQNTPSMTQKREQHSCVIHPATSNLYAFGGYVNDYDSATFLSSVEQINIIDISHNNWSYVGDLTALSSNTRAVVYKSMIFVIGVHHIHTLDVLTDQISVFQHPLPLLLNEVSAIVVDHTLYIFGGWIGGLQNRVDFLLTYDLQTMNITTTNSAISAIDSDYSKYVLIVVILLYACVTMFGVYIWSLWRKKKKDEVVVKVIAFSDGISAKSQNKAPEPSNIAPIDNGAVEVIAFKDIPHNRNHHKCSSTIEIVCKSNKHKVRLPSEGNLNDNATAGFNAKVNEQMQIEEQIEYELNENIQNDEFIVDGFSQKRK